MRGFKEGWDLLYTELRAQLHGLTSRGLTPHAIYIGQEDWKRLINDVRGLQWFRQDGLTPKFDGIEVIIVERAHHIHVAPEPVHLY